MTLPPTEPPASGAAVEHPPHGLDDRPRTLVYTYPRPSLWVYWPNFWQEATVLARQDYRDGRVVYQVELKETPDAAASKVTRTFLWGPDSIRPVDDEA